MEKALSSILRAGVLASSLLLAAGLAWMMMEAAGQRCSLEDVAGETPQGARTLVTAGLVVLLATPLTRVVASLLLFWRQRDWPFVVMTLWVLLVIAVGLLVALP